jgi:hypothetical protein
LNSDERAFIDASIAADRLARKRVVLGVSAFVVAVTLAGAVAFWQYLVADQQRQLAVARQLAAEAQVFVDSSSGKGAQRSLFMATASLHAAWTEEGFNAWGKAIKLVPPLPSVLDAERGPYTSVTFSSDGTLMAAAGKDAIFLFDGTSFKQIFEFPQSGAQRLALSPNAQFLAAGVGADGAGRSVVIWDFAKRQRVQDISSGSEEVTSIAFDSHANRLAFASFASLYPVRVFDTRDWKELTQDWRPEWPARDGVGYASGSMFIA